MLGNLIGSFIVVIVGSSLAPTVAQNVGTAQNDGNITGAADTLLGLTTLFYCLAIATSSMASAAIGLRNAGWM
jgi:hypothetical protein